VARVLAGHPVDSYAYTGQAGEAVYGSSLLEEALHQVGVAGLTVLVVGTMVPWVEAILLARGAARVVTLDYAYKISTHPSWEWIRPPEFRARFLAGQLPKFDRIVSYSSVEHSGLGRYGDALNPYGDLMAVAQAWCASSPQALLVLGVPTDLLALDGGPGEDRLMFNAGRVYGPHTFPLLATNWAYSWPEGGRRTPPCAQDTCHRYTGLWLSYVTQHISDFSLSLSSKR